MADRGVHGKTYRAVGYVIRWLADNWIWEYGAALNNGVDLEEFTGRQLFAYASAAAVRHVSIPDQDRKVLDEVREAFDQLMLTAEQQRVLQEIEEEKQRKLEMEDSGGFGAAADMFPGLREVPMG